MAKVAQKAAKEEFGAMAGQLASEAVRMGADHRVDGAVTESANVMADQTKKLLHDMQELRDLMAARERKLGSSGPAGKVCKMMELKTKCSRKQSVGKVAAVVGTGGAALVNDVLRSSSESAIVLQTIESLFMSGFTEIWYVDVEMDGKTAKFVKPSAFKAVKGSAKIWGDKDETIVHTVEEPIDVHGAYEEGGPLSGIHVWNAVLHSAETKMTLPLAQSVFQAIKRRTPEGEKPLMLLLRTPPDNQSGYMTVVEKDIDIEREWHGDFLGLTRDSGSVLISSTAAAVLGGALANAAFTYVKSGQVPIDFGFESDTFTITRHALWPGNILQSTQQRQAVDIQELNMKVEDAEQLRIKTMEAADQRCLDQKAELEKKFEEDMKQLAEYKAKMDLAVNTKCGAVASMFTLALDSYPIEDKPWNAGLPGSEIDPDKITTDHDGMMLHAAQFIEKDNTLDKYYLGDTAIDPINTAIYHIAKKQSMGFMDNMDKVVDAYTAQAEAQECYITELQKRVTHLEGILKKNDILDESVKSTATAQGTQQFNSGVF